MPSLCFSADPDVVAKDIAEFVVPLSRRAIAQNGRFSVAFSGGESVAVACGALVREPTRSEIDWELWHVFFVDEKCVQLKNPQSNYHLVEEHLLQHVPIQEMHVYTCTTSMELEHQATDYESILRRHFNLPALDSGIKPSFHRSGVEQSKALPAFDLIFLSLGLDGHVASLFPGHPALLEISRFVTPVTDAPEPPEHRITMTLQVINNAKEVAVVTAGAEKGLIIQRVFEDEGKLSSDRLPIQLVHGQKQLRWFVDEDAVRDSGVAALMSPRREY